MQYGLSMLNVNSYVYHVNISEGQLSRVEQRREGSTAMLEFHIFHRELKIKGM